MRRDGGRRVVVAGWASAQHIFSAVVAERDALRQELIELHRDHAELLATLHELQADVQALRSQAEQRVAELHRLRDIERARAAERDPGQRLN